LPFVGAAIAGWRRRRPFSKRQLASLVPPVPSFEELGNNDDIVNQYAALESSLGRIGTPRRATTSARRAAGTSASNFFPLHDALDIFFTQVVNGTAFQYGSNP
jgi:hypothetical protein